MPSYLKKTAMTLVLGLLCIAVSSTQVRANQVLANKKPSDYLKYIPKSAEIIVGLDVAASRTTVSFKALLKFAKTDASFKRIVRDLKKDTGVQLERDVDQLLIAFPQPQGHIKKIGRSFVMIAVGTFDKKRLEQEMNKDKKTKKTKQGAYTFFEHKSRKMLFGFLNNRTIMFASGSNNWRKRARLLTLGKGKDVTKNLDIKSLLGHVDTTKHIWAIGNTDTLIQDDLEKVHKFATDIDLRKGFGWRALFQMTSPSSAQKIIDTFQASRFKWMAAAAMINATSFVSNMKWTAKASKLSMSTSMTNAEVRAMSDTFHAMERQKKDAAKKMREEKKAKAASAKQKASTTPKKNAPTQP